MWFTGPPVPPGSRTIEAMRTLRKAIHWYVFALILSGLAALLSAVFEGSILYGWSGGLPTGFGSSMASPAMLPQDIAILAAISGVGLAGFVLLLIAWFTWRDGATSLARSAAEYGPSAADAARRGREAWTYTTVIFVVGVVVTAVVGVAVVLTSVLPLVHGNTTNVTAVRASVPVAEIAVVAGAVSLVVSLLYYWFATGGLVGSLEALAPAETAARARAARTTILIGAALAGLGLVGFFVPYGSLLAVFSPATLVWGFWMLQGAYDEWLIRPPLPGALAAPPATRLPSWPPG